MLTWIIFWIHSQNEYFMYSATNQRQNRRKHRHFRKHVFNSCIFTQQITCSSKINSNFFIRLFVKTFLDYSFFIHKSENPDGKILICHRHLPFTLVLFLKKKKKIQSNHSIISRVNWQLSYTIISFLNHLSIQSIFQPNIYTYILRCKG